jgi:hypothetical protein
MSDEVGSIAVVIYHDDQGRVTSTRRMSPLAAQYMRRADYRVKVMTPEDAELYLRKVGHRGKR